MKLIVNNNKTKKSCFQPDQKLTFVTHLRQTFFYSLRKLLTIFYYKVSKIKIALCRSQYFNNLTETTFFASSALTSVSAISTERMNNLSLGVSEVRSHFTSFGIPFIYLIICIFIIDANKLNVLRSVTIKRRVTNKKNFTDLNYVFFKLVFQKPIHFLEKNFFSSFLQFSAFKMLFKNRQTAEWSMPSNNKMKNKPSTSLYNTFHVKLAGLQARVIEM